MRLNPIVKKDVRVQSRSIKISFGVFAYELILALVFFFAMYLIQQENMYLYDNIYSSLVALYPALALTQFMILGLIVPVRTASSISGERERQTFDIMMTTGMTPFSVVTGKVMTAIVQSMLFIAASLPIMALSFVVGGMSWSYLFWFFAVALLISFFSASIGILCSSLCKKSVSAVIMSYGFYLIFFIGTVLPPVFYRVYYFNIMYGNNFSGSRYSYGENIYLTFLLNPAVYLAEFFSEVMTGESLFDSFNGVSSSGMRGPVGLVTTGHNWIIVSTILFLAVSVLFLFLAARRIDPARGRMERRKAKKRA
ncbi:MAG: ABC transporter permease [Lachnospiraceae bacterium]|nr:ABC transporter permease [Lachnospiraceae bacterium]